ncbi:septum formation initiator family protein [Acidocella sp. KAb 2-4]|uniref:FtsB family cell division protein n=1 Tax=Acidocella sp. KAb 2-4 TaxID=2885158 RepID=UPI001D09996B|nr:septum formation initiator family protein [Acidocella sp. KAb 2-4]
MIKYRLRGFIAPAILLGITYYFGWNAVHGKSGLEAQQAQKAQLAQAQAQYQAVHEQRQMWQTKIADLSGQSIHRDMLEEQAREVLNLADPGDIVIDLSSSRAAE